MRIGMIITELHPGGAERCFVNLACYLQQRGHQVAVWELWPAPPPEKRQLCDQLDRYQIPWRSAGATRAWDFPRLSGWLKRELQKFNPEIVQAFLFHANLAAALASRRQPWRLFGGARVSQPERFRQLAQRWAAKHMEKLVCVSHSVQAHCESREHIPPHKLTVIPNGIRLGSRSPDRSATIDLALHGLPRTAPLLLFVGRLAAQKGVRHLLEHSASLLDKLPEHQLVILGDGPLRGELQKARDKSPAASRIHLLGWQPNPLQWMEHCEQLLLPAVYEGMPNVLLEGMSLGKPVVAFDVDGIGELLGDDPLAGQQIIPAGDHAGFIAAIQDFAENPELRTQCGVHNLARVQTFFDLEKQLAKYEELYAAAARPQ